MLRTEGEARRALKGGIVGGLIGGLVSAIILMAVAAMNGQSGWAMMKGAAAPFLHERAMTPGYDLVAVLAGTISHFTISMIWGALFGLLAFGLPRSTTIWFGVLWGFVVWIGMHYIVLPLVGLGALASADPIPMAIGFHVIFGVAVALGFLPFQQVRVSHFRPA